MNSLLYLIIQIINLFEFVLIVYTFTWLVNFNIISTGNRFVLPSWMFYIDYVSLNKKILTYFWNRFITNSCFSRFVVY